MRKRGRAFARKRRAAICCPELSDAFTNRFRRVDHAYPQKTDTSTQSKAIKRLDRHSHRQRWRGDRHAIHRRRETTRVMRAKVGLAMAAVASWSEARAGGGLQHRFRLTLSHAAHAQKKNRLPADRFLNIARFSAHYRKA